MCYVLWHLPWKLNLLNCCLESHTSINWRGSVDIWLSDISSRDGLLQRERISVRRIKNKQKNYLLLLSALQVPPLLRYVAEIHLVHRHLDVTDGVVFGEAVEVVHGHDQRLPAELHVGNLRRMKTGCEGLSRDKLSLKCLWKTVWRSGFTCPCSFLFKEKPDVSFCDRTVNKHSADRRAPTEEAVSLEGKHH